MQILKMKNIVKDSDADSQMKIDRVDDHISASTYQDCKLLLSCFVRCPCVKAGGM